MTLQQVNNGLEEVLTSIGISRTALTDEATFSRDLGLDSLDVTNLLIQVELYFSIRIPDEDWWTLQTIGRLKAYLAKEMLFDGSQLTS